MSPPSPMTIASGSTEARHLAGEPQRVDGRGVRRRRLVAGVDRGGPPRPAAPRATAVGSARPSLPSWLEQGAQERPTSRRPEVDGPVVPDLVGLRVDVDDRHVVAVRGRPAVPEPEVEVDAEREDDVGLAQRVLAGQPEQVRVRGGQDPAGHAVDVHRQLGELGELVELLPRPAQ
jgi:hypothetical protein